MQCYKLFRDVDNLESDWKQHNCYVCMISCIFQEKNFIIVYIECIYVAYKAYHQNKSTLRVYLHLLDVMLNFLQHLGSNSELSIKHLLQFHTKKQSGWAMPWGSFVFCSSCLLSSGFCLVPKEFCSLRVYLRCFMKVRW